MLKVLITSGGTREYIDDVRVLTNVSSGKLGAEIAEIFSENPDIQVYYIHAENAKKPPLLTQQGKNNTLSYPVTDVNSLYKVMKECVPEVDVVIHAMAVSDFGFKPCNEKLKSSDPEAFIESMRSRIIKNPKILPLIKVWNPNCKLVSFKFEVGLSNAELINVAKESMVTGKSDIVIANDKIEMINAKSHIAYAIEHIDSYNISTKITKLKNKSEIANYLYERLK